MACARRPHSRMRLHLRRQMSARAARIAPLDVRYGSDPASRVGVVGRRNELASPWAVVSGQERFAGHATTRRNRCRSSTRWATVGGKLPRVVLLAETAAIVLAAGSATALADGQQGCAGRPGAALRTPYATGHCKPGYVLTTLAIDSEVASLQSEVSTLRSEVSALQHDNADAHGRGLRAADHAHRRQLQGERPERKADARDLRRERPDRQRHGRDRRDRQRPGKPVHRL
jgi:hypothetical protein